MTGREQTPAQIKAGVDEKMAPVFWPTLIPGEVPQEWAKLRSWVARLQARFPHSVRLPPCWWWHNELVEALSALRDHERASFGPSAPPSAAADWHRAFRDLEARMDTWIKRFGCAVPGRDHPPSTDEATWQAFVADDVRRHEQAAADAAAELTHDAS